jgi:hypothetical protein
MTSQLSISEFKSRMKYHTKTGDPILKLTPFFLFTIFTKAGKKFYGEFNDSHFELTKNAEFWPIPYIIDGNYRFKNETETELFYKIKTVKFYYWTTRIVALLTLVLVNYLFFFKSDNNIQLNIIFILNLLLIPFFSVGFLIEKYMKKRMERNFKEIFRIDR